ncbi:LysR family transcriptional regulator [Erysipelothrix sp. D19-032]
MGGYRAYKQEEPVQTFQKKHVGGKMDLKKLGYFVTLVEEGNFSRVMKALYITQPRLSWNVKELEEMMGTQLVKRSTTGIEITEAGNALYTGAKTLLMDAR